VHDTVLGSKEKEVKWNVFSIGSVKVKNLTMEIRIVFPNAGGIVSKVLSYRSSVHQLCYSTISLWV